MTTKTRRVRIIDRVEHSRSDESSLEPDDDDIQPLSMDSSEPDDDEIDEL